MSLARTRAPIRLVHLGLGNFFRAHQAWYTDRADDADEWGYAAFTGRRPDLAVALAGQDCRYTLVTRAADGDSCELVSSLSAVHAAADHDSWLGYFSSAKTAAVTVTVTEAGYLARPDGSLGVGRPEVAADIAALRADPTAPVRTAPARLLAGLAARRRADAGPLAIVPCDNLPSNGSLTRRVITELAELVDAGLAAWLNESVAVVTTVVDRITPRITATDVRMVREVTGIDDRCPVITEPFTDWVLSGQFPAGRPRWQDCGATFTGDILPFEERKIWLLNGAHSLIAYAGSIAGHATVADAVASQTCLEWLTEWWDEASAHLDQPTADIASYRAALLARFQNSRMRDSLARIAADGSQKLPVRVLPVLRAERQAGHMPTGAARVIAAWVCHLRGQGAPIDDARAEQVLPLVSGGLGDAVSGILRWLDSQLAGDRDLVALVTELSEEFSRLRRREHRC